MQTYSCVALFIYCETFALCIASIIMGMTVHNERKIDLIRGLSIEKSIKSSCIHPNACFDYWAACDAALAG